LQLNLFIVFGLVNKMQIKKFKINKNKIAAMELSVGTAVVIVLAVTMLILGLVLVRNIFSGATESVSELNEKVKSEITNLFSESSSNLIIKLGSDRTARVKAGTEEFGIAIGARTKDGSTVDLNKLKYKLSLDTSTKENCYQELGMQKTQDLFLQKMDTNLEFDRFEGDTTFAIIQISIPEGTELCSQKVYIDIQDNGEPLGREMFILKVERKGLL